MSTEDLRPRENLELRLSACYLAAALFTAAAAIVALSRQPHEPLEAGSQFWSAAVGAYWGGIIYLLMTVASHARRSFELRRSVRIDNPARLWPGHALVFAASVFCLVRGPASRAMLAGLDRLAASLAIASLLACLLAIVAWRALPAAGPGMAEGDSAGPSRWRIAYIFFALGSAAASGSLICLEVWALPGTQAG